MKRVYRYTVAHFLVFASSAAILFVSSIPERNRLDHTWMEKKIFDLDQSIDVLYCNLPSLSSLMSLGRDKALFLWAYGVLDSKKKNKFVFFNCNVICKCIHSVYHDSEIKIKKNHRSWSWPLIPLFTKMIFFKLRLGRHIFLVYSRKSVCNQW